MQSNYLSTFNYHGRRDAYFTKYREKDKKRREEAAVLHVKEYFRIDLRIHL